MLWGNIANSCEVEISKKIDSRRLSEGNRISDEEIYYGGKWRHNKRPKKNKVAESQYEWCVTSN